jgi:hypothetical protein
VFNYARSPRARFFGGPGISGFDFHGNGIANRIHDFRDEIDLTQTVCS